MVALPLKIKRHRVVKDYPVLLPHEVFACIVGQELGEALLWGSIDLGLWWEEARQSDHPGLDNHPAHTHPAGLSTTSCMPIKIHGVGRTWLACCRSCQGFLQASALVWPFFCPRSATEDEGPFLRKKQVSVVQWSGPKHDGDCCGPGCTNP
jgi:hypothetical protein